MSFVDEEDVHELIDPLMQRLLALGGIEVSLPLERLPYDEALLRYGSDRPDRRLGVEIVDLSAAFTDSSFAVFRDALAAGGEVRGFVVPGAARYSRRELDELIEQAKQLGAGGLVWARAPEGTVQSPIVKAAGEASIRRALDIAGARPEDLLLVAAGRHDPTSRLLGALRLHMARKENLLDPS
jgi:aspartyl-tRNA synthetase